MLLPAGQVLTVTCSRIGSIPEIMQSGIPAQES
jgi:hypothetical protein